MNPKISMIVPCYNVEKFLPNCFASIERQTFRDFEVIFINDASTDKTKALLQEYIKDRVYAKYFEHDVNKGLGEAHNTGINNALGEFITFYDPDDVLHPRFLEMLYETIKKYDVDMAICKFKRVRINNLKKFKMEKVCFREDIIESKEEIINSIFSLDEYLSWMDWNKIYRSKIIKDNNINFGSLRWADDVFFNASYIIHIERVVLNHSILYCYVQNKGSLMHSKFSNKYYDIHKCLLELLKRNYSECLELNIRKFFAYSMVATMNRAIFSRYKNKADFKRLLEILSSDINFLKKNARSLRTVIWFPICYFYFKIIVSFIRDKGDNLSEELKFDYPIDFSKYKEKI